MPSNRATLVRSTRPAYRTSPSSHARRATRRPYDKRGLENDIARRTIGVTQTIQQQLRSRAPYLVSRLRYRGKRRVQRDCPREIVKSDDGDVVRNIQPARVNGL